MSSRPPEHASDGHRRTLDHLLEGFQILAPDWRYLYVNPAAAAQGRRTPSELVGRRIMDVYPGVEASPLFAMLEGVMNDRAPRAMENLFAFADGTSRWFELRIEPVPDGVCVHSVDIDDRKRAEGELLRANEQLEACVEQRTAELQRANRDLEAFAYSVSHDLRAPLRAISGFGQMLEEDCSEALGVEGRRYVARMRGAAERMSRLIDDLLALSRIGRAALRLREVDVSALVAELARDLDERDPARRIEWRIGPGLRVWADEGLTRIVFQNLLENAWKFTAKRDDAWIQVRESTDTPGAFVVVDNGAGFDMSGARELFKPFRRLHADQDFAGTGIGLATVHRIAEQHGGAVIAHGAVGEGAAITVSFGPSP